MAAPFTGIATEETDHSAQLTFIDIPQLHGKIKPGEYRRMLQSVEKKLKKLNIDTLIPHRDINKWGDKVLSPNEAVMNCTESVVDCDLFVGILGNSCGAHYEFGVAKGKSKPCVLVLCNEIDSSFLGKGFECDDNQLVLKCEKISEISSLFDKPDFLTFIHKIGF